MKIAIFSDTFPPQINGVANVAYQTAQGLAARGHEVVVCAPRLNRTTERSRENSFRLIELPSLPFIGYSGQRLALPLGEAIRSLRAFRPDIIHTHTPFTVGREAIRAAQRFGVPLVGTHHTFFDHYLRHVKLDYPWAKTLSWKFVIRYYNHCACVLGPSRSLMQTMKDYGLTVPLLHMPNSVDTQRFKPVKNMAEQKLLKKEFNINGWGIVYAGRVSYEKSIDCAIRAFAIAKKHIPDLTFMIVGDGPERHRLERLTDNLGLSRAVRFTGFLRDTSFIKALRANDIFLTASKSENMPISILEGMAVGLPIVGVDALGVPEIVHHAQNGLLAPPDMPEALSAHLITLVNDGKQRRTYARASRKMALGYAPNIVISSLEKLYRSVLEL